MFDELTASWVKWASNQHTRLVAIEVGGSSIQSVAVDHEGIRFIDGVAEVGEQDRYGFAAPGYVVDGRVLGAHHIGWIDVFAPDELGTPNNVAVSLNDAAAQADGEWRLRSLLRGELTYVGIGTGIGGIRVNNGVVTDIELGHRVSYGDLVCHGCGRKGCLDAQFGAHALPPAPLDEVTMERMGRSLADAISRTCPAIGSTVVLGGGVVRCNPRLLDLLSERLKGAKVEHSLAPRQAKSAAFVGLLGCLVELGPVTRER